MASFDNWMKQEQARKAALFNDIDTNDVITYGLDEAQQFEGIDIEPEFNRSGAIAALEEMLMADRDQRDIDSVFGEITKEQVTPPQEREDDEAMQIINSYNVDYDFLRDVEGFETTGYVPTKGGKVLGQSGVTIGSGVDLGQWNAESFADMGVPESIIEKVSPYFGKKKEDAVKFLEENPLELSEEEVIELNDTVKNSITAEVAERFNKDTSNFNFEDLPAELQTAVTSVAFQYGNKAYKQNFWKQITSGDWLGAYRNLRNFGDKYKTRRNREADLIRAPLIEEIGVDPLILSQIDEETRSA